MRAEIEPTAKTQTRPSGADGGTAARAGWALLAFMTTTVPGLFAVLLCALVNGIRCDDGCNVNSGWRSNPVAWQWDFQFWGLAVPGAIASVCVSVALAARRTRLAWASLVATALFYCGWEAMALGSSTNQLANRVADVVAHPVLWLPYLVIVLGGLLAISGSQRRPTQDGRGQRTGQSKGPTR